MADSDTTQTQVDFAARAAGWVDELTKFLQTRAVSPLFWIARVIIFGLLGLGLVIVAAVLGTDVLVKLLDAYVFAGRVWITYFVIGGIALIVSIFAWRKMGKYRFREAKAVG